MERSFHPALDIRMKELTAYYLLGLDWKNFFTGCFSGNIVRFTVFGNEESDRA